MESSLQGAMDMFRWSTSQDRVRLLTRVVTNYSHDEVL